MWLHLVSTTQNVVAFGKHNKKWRSSLPGLHTLDPPLSPPSTSAELFRTTSSPTQRGDSILDYSGGNNSIQEEDTEHHLVDAGQGKPNAGVGQDTSQETSLDRSHQESGAGDPPIGHHRQAGAEGPQTSHQKSGAVGPGRLAHTGWASQVGPAKLAQTVVQASNHPVQVRAMMKNTGSFLVSGDIVNTHRLV